ncbi:hypothetical protein [Photobacterium marinum]|nr:hypothetical protein [Photobacterium marinum]
MTKLKKKRLKGITFNSVLLIVALILSYMNILGIIPMIVAAFSAIALFGNGLLYFFNSDEDTDDQPILDDTAKIVARSGIDGLAEFRKK